jgi:quercetin dioxygenase-like cupin family protein
MSTAVPVIRDADEGERRQFWGGGLLTIKASTEETAGSVFIFEDQMARGKVTPLHSHNEDEVLFVIEGEIVVHVDGDERRLGRGGFAFAPRAVPHAFMVASDTARVLTVLTPGSAEDFYMAASEPAQAGAEPGGPVNFARVGEAAESSGGMQMLGPPPFA